MPTELLPHVFPLKQLYSEQVRRGELSDDPNAYTSQTTPGYEIPQIETRDRTLQQATLLFAWAALTGVCKSNDLPPIVAGLNCKGIMGRFLSHINEDRLGQAIFPWGGKDPIAQRVEVIEQYPLGYARVELTSTAYMCSNNKPEYRTVRDQLTLLELVKADKVAPQPRLEIDLLASLITADALEIRKNGVEASKCPQIEQALVTAAGFNCIRGIRAGFGIRNPDGTTFATGLQHVSPAIDERLAYALSPQGMDDGIRTWLIFFESSMPSRGESWALTTTIRH